MRNTRREFLKFVIIAPVIGPGISYASNKSRLMISSFNIDVPVWLLRKKSKEKARVQVVSIEKINDKKKIAILFEGDKQLTLNSNSSVKGIIRRNTNRSTRESILLKRIISYGIDAMFLNVANKRHPIEGAYLKKEFDALQAEEVVEMVTIGALYDLMSKLNKLTIISSVSWDSARQLFIVR